MKFALFALVSLAFSSTNTFADSKPQMSCQAVYRTLDEKNNTVERIAKLSVKPAGAGAVKHETVFEGRFFTLTEELASRDLFAQITKAPNLERGTVSRGAADSQGRFTATEVVGYTVYRLECSRAGS